ncbi:O-antigen ligase family protein [Actinoplanes sp. NPDC049265]|uniref:O-antigen ligase family protein n=1 Tax=Actinoplanes sp. NPDC049265 TaxID=3363902 RepID=UPI00370F7E54
MTIVGSREHDVALPELTASGDKASPFWVVALVLLGYAGYYKGSPLASWAPIDITVALASVVFLGIGIRVVRSRVLPLMPITRLAITFVAFLPGLAFATSTTKVVLLFTITLACAVSPCLFVDPAAPRWWLGANVAGAGAMCIAAAVFPNQETWKLYGRLALEGGDTIGTGRVIGAGVVVLAALTISTSRLRALTLGAALAGFVGLAAVGSRGPLGGVIIATLGAMLLARRLRGRRAGALVGVSALAAVAWYLASYFQTGGSERIGQFLSGDSGDAGRNGLAAAALSRIGRDPLGMGWGGFEALGLTSAGRPLKYPHNITLEIAVEGGWIAAAGFIALMIFALAGYVRNSRTPEGMAALALGTYWIVVAHSSSDVNGNRMTWISIAIGLATLGSGTLTKRHRTAGEPVEPRPQPATAEAR